MHSQTFKTTWDGRSNPIGGPGIGFFIEPAFVFEGRSDDEDEPILRHRGFLQAPGSLPVRAKVQAPNGKVYEIPINSPRPIQCGPFDSVTIDQATPEAWYVIHTFVDEGQSIGPSDDSSQRLIVPVKQWATLVTTRPVGEGGAAIHPPYKTLNITLAFEDAFQDVEIWVRSATFIEGTYGDAGNWALSEVITTDQFLGNVTDNYMQVITRNVTFPGGRVYLRKTAAADTVAAQIEARMEF